jgi:hypothetical protein
MSFFRSFVGRWQAEFSALQTNLGDHDIVLDAFVKSMTLSAPLAVLVPMAVALVYGVEDAPPAQPSALSQSVDHVGLPLLADAVLRAVRGEGVEQYAAAVSRMVSELPALAERANHLAAVAEAARPDLLQDRRSASVPSASISVP